VCLRIGSLLLVCLSIYNLIDYSEKSRVSDKGTELLPDCERNQDKLLCVFLFSLPISFIFVALNSEHCFRFELYQKLNFGLSYLEEKANTVHLLPLPLPHRHTPSCIFLTFRVNYISSFNLRITTILNLLYYAITPIPLIFKLLEIG